MSEQKNFEELRDDLQTVPTGPIKAEHAARIFSRVKKCWSIFKGGSTTEFEGHKLFERDGRPRYEEPYWRPPIVSFQIVRHGAMMAGGSTRGEVQLWQVDLDDLTANRRITAFRSVEKSAPKWDHKPIVREIVACVKAGPQAKGHEALAWRGHDEIAIIPSLVVPRGTAAATRNGRRQKFVQLLISELTTIAWDLVSRQSNASLRFKRKMV